MKSTGEIVIAEGLVIGLIAMPGHLDDQNVALIVRRHRDQLIVRSKSTCQQRAMVEYADLALYKVKRSGRNAYSMYHPEMRAAESHSINGEQLLQALRDNEFRLDYQPVVDARTGELRASKHFCAGFNRALVRGRPANSCSWWSRNSSDRPSANG